MDKSNQIGLTMSISISVDEISIQLTFNRPSRNRNTNVCHYICLLAYFYFCFFFTTWQVRFQLNGSNDPTGSQRAIAFFFYDLTELNDETVRQQSVGNDRRNRIKNPSSTETQRGISRPEAVLTAMLFVNDAEEKKNRRKKIK